MTDIIEEQLSKSRTTYRNLHHPPSPSISPSLPKMQFVNKMNHTDESDDDSTLPTFVNRFFFPKNLLNNSPPPPLPASSNDTGMFRAIRGQVIIHHDYDRSSKVQREEEDDEEELENFPINRPNVGNYELHYDVDNPLEISCSMSLSSAETISDHSPSPVRLTSSININGNDSAFKRHQTPIESSSSEDDDDDDGDNTPSSILSDNDHHEEKKLIDHDNIKEQDEKLRTFRGWHLSMLKQIDEKLREIELETAATTTITPVIQNKKTILKPIINNTNKKLLRPTIRRRFETTNIKRHNSPVPQIKLNNHRSRTPSVEKESRTLIINLPPSSSSSSSSSPPSDDEQDFPPPPAPSEPINIRIVRSPIYPTRQRSQSTDHLILRDQGAQTEPVDNNRSLRPASVECDRTQATRSLTRTQGAQFLQQQQQQQQTQERTQRPTEQIKFYSLRSRSAQARPSVVTQLPMPMSQLPPKPSFVHNRSSPTEQQTLPPKFPPPPPPVSADPFVYSDDYGHCTQMDTSNLGTLVDRVFDDIYQDKPSDFYRDYRQLLNDIQIRFSMISSTDQPPIIHPPPPPPPIHRQPPIPPTFVDYSRVSQSPSSQARLCDTLIYIPNSH